MKDDLFGLLAKGKEAIPEVYDCISVRAAEICGYPAVCLSAEALACALSGKRDESVVSGELLYERTLRIRMFTTLPFVVAFPERLFENAENAAAFHSRLFGMGVDAVLIRLTDGKNMLYLPDKILPADDMILSDALLTGCERALNLFAQHAVHDGHTLFHDAHDFDGLLGEHDYHCLFGFHRQWLTLEQELDDKGRRLAQENAT